MTTPTLDLVPKLISGVAKAVPVGGSELDVTTIISRPMWRRWCVELGYNPDGDISTPMFNYNCPIRVFGSDTHVVEHESEFALSFATR